MTTVTIEAPSFSSETSAVKLTAEVTFTEGLFTIKRGGVTLFSSRESPCVVTLTTVQDVQPMELEAEGLEVIQATAVEVAGLE